jgi:hypothetical protein
VPFGGSDRLAGFFEDLSISFTGALDFLSGRNRGKGMELLDKDLEVALSF